MPDMLEDEIVDISETICEGRALRSSKQYRIKIGNEKLKFKKYLINDPVPLARQLLEVANAHPFEEHSIVAILPNGDFEDLRLDEPFNIWQKGVERFLIFRTDRSFKFKIDDRNLEWPHACISGFVLKKIADLPDNYNLWLDVRGGQDRQIDDADLVSFEEVGVERFMSLPPEQICIIINTREKLVDQGVISFSKLVKIAFPNTSPSENTAYTVSFYKGTDECPEGTLIEGETVVLKKRMVFNVSETDKS